MKRYHRDYYTEMFFCSFGINSYRKLQLMNMHIGLDTTVQLTL